MEHPSTSAPAFHNVQPRTREERQAAKDKTSLEKARIAQRSTRGEAPPDNILQPVSASPMAIDEYTRFAQRDAAAAEHARRQEVLHRKEEMYERKRVEHYHRQAEAYHSNVAAHEREQAKASAKREAGQGGARRNKSGEDYNILTLDYANTPQGQALQYKDQTTQYKAALRAQTLYTKGQSVSHNIITGAPVWQPSAPQRPVAPWDK